MASSDEFAGIPADKLGLAANSLTNTFKSLRPDMSKEDEEAINGISERMLREYRDKAGINNFIPKAEEWDTYYAPRPDFSLAKTAEEKIKMSVDWKAASLEKAADLVPSLRKDFDTHLEYITNNDIRESVFEAKKSKGGAMAWLDDKANRTIEGGLTMVAPFFDGSDRWLAENFPEDPSTNENISSQLFAGAGQLVVQAGIALGTSAIAGPEAGAAAIGTIYSARALVEGYKEEMRKSGNTSKALDVGIAGIPGALLETVADNMLFGMGKSGKVYLDAFRKAATEEAKRAILKEAFPALGKQALKNGISEATVGSIGADWTTGYGRYLASGDDSYIPTAEQLGKGALVEGILGAGYSSLNSMAFDGSRTKAFAMELADKNKSKANDIYKALAGKNYQEAVEIAARDYPDVTPTPTAATPAAPGVTAPATPGSAPAPTASGIVIPQPNASSKIISASVLGSENYKRLLQIRDTLKKEAGTDTGSLETLKRVTEALDAISNGTYQEPESYSLGLDKIGNKDGFTEKSTSNSTEETSYDVTLDNGKSIKSDSSTIFISGFDKSTVITKVIAAGEVGLVLRDGKVHFVSPVNGKLVGSSGLPYSNKPSRSGQTAVSINQSLVNNNNENESVVTNFSILGKVDKSSKSKESKQKDSEAFDKLAAKENEETKDKIKEASIKEAKELVESIGNNTSFSDEAVNGEGGIKQAILDKIKIFNSIIGTSPDKLDDVIDAKDRLLKALAEAEGKITSSPSAKPVRGNVPLFQAKVEEQKTQEQVDRGFVMPKPILQGVPTVGSQVSYEGYEGTLKEDEGGKYTIEQNDGAIVEVADIAGVSLVKNAAAITSELNDFVSDETPVDLDTQVANQEVAKAQLAQAFFTPTTNEEMSITDQFGNEYVPHNESLSKNFETTEDGGLEVLVRNKANPGKIIRLTGPQALQAQEAFLENVTNLENAGFKVSLDSKFTGKKKTPAEKLDDEIKQEVEVVQKAKRERKKKEAPVKKDELVTEPTNDEEAAKTKEFTQDEIDSKKKIGEGSESEVYEDGDNVIKVAESYNAKETLAERVVYALRAERLLGNLSGLRYAGFRRGKNGVLNPVFSQRKIEGESASKEQVKALFKKYGWTENPNGTFSIVTPEGKVTTLSDIYDGGNIINVNGAAVPRDVGTIVEPVAVVPTPSNITSTPEAIFESVTDEGVVVETVVVPASEPVVLDGEVKLIKEIERTKRLIADDPSYEVTLKEQEDQLALLRATGAKDVPTAVQQAQDERAQDDKEKQEAAAANKDEDVKISLSPKEDAVTNEEEFADDPEFENNKKSFEDEKAKTSDRSKAIQIVKKYHRLGYVSDSDLFSAKKAGDATDVFDQVTFSQKPKLGIQKGQVAVVDVEVTNPRKGDEDGYHIFSAGGKSYAVKYIKSGELKGWHLFGPETNGFTNIGNNKEDARSMLATLVNRDPNTVILKEATVQDKSNSELLKEVVYAPAKIESVEEKIEKLNQKAKDAANKVISDKVDEFVATVEQPARKANWENNKQAIVDYINDTISGVKEAVDTLFDKLKTAGVKPVGIISIRKYADDIASSLSEKAKEQIQKDRNETVVDEVDEKDTNKEEPAVEEDIIESVEEVVEELSKEEVSEIAEELNVPNNSISVSDALSTAYSDWLVNAKEFSDKVVAILKKVSVSLKNKIAAIAIAISVLPTIINSSIVVDTKIYDLNEVKSFGTAFREEQKKNLSVDFGGLDSLEINIPKSSNSKMSVPANINISFDKETDFGGVSYSENVKDASDWILNSSNNEGKPYLVADKVNGLIYVFDKNGKLKKRTYAIFGKDQGDVIQDGKFITPAGVYKTSVDNNVSEPYYGGTTVDFLDKGETVLAIHRVYLAKPSEKRLDRLKSKDPSDNRISHGCINVTDQIYDNIIYPEFNSANGGMVYILPETKQGNKIVERQKLANAKIKYSIGSEQPGATIDPKEAQDYIAKNHPGIETVNTRKTTEDGHQWRGRTDFVGGAAPKITINLANIRDLAQLRNVIHEELAHIAYNDPGISTSLSKIAESTKLQEELAGLYSPGDVFEESVVKRMADLVDSYTEKGAFGRLVTAIKSLFKDTFGMELNDSDLSYIAYRAIVRAGKVTSYSKELEGQTRFQKEPSNNTTTPSPLFEPDDDALSVATGKISEEKKRTLKNLKRAIRKKLEKELIIDEPQAWNALKAVNYRYLDGDQLKSFNALLWQFVRTRSKSKDPGIGVRTPTDTVIAEATELAKAANQGHFNALQLQHDFLEGKDFQNDFQGDIDKVNQLAKDERGMKDSDTPTDKDADSLQTWQLRMYELQEEAWENRDYLQDRLDEQFPSANNITNNPIIAKRAGIYTETVDDVMAGHKEVAKQYINSLMADPTDKTWRELRRQYYGLQDFLADGYLNVEDFVSEDMTALLQGKISEETFVKMYNTPWRSKMHEGASSFYANTRTMGTEVAELAHNLTKKFRAGILAAERLMADFIDPTLNEFMDKAVALNGGKPFDGEQLNLAGIYGRARQFKATESVTEGILKSKEAIEGSLKKDTNSIRAGRKEAALIHSKFTSDLYAGIDANTPNEEALGILEANAERLLPSGLIGYVKDVVELFEVTKPLSRFTSEFGLGRPFDEIINYIPSMAINKDGTPVKTDGLLITNTSDDVAMGVVGEINKDTNMQQSGGSSTKIRKGFLPEGMVYAWNINHLAHNRMRLNLNDYLTLPQRRELNNIISGKGTKRDELAKLLKDDGQQERVSHIQRTVLTMWQNTVQASNYVSEGQGFMNMLSNMWASTKLASVYQLPGQIASNTIPYFIVNAGNPKRIKYLFDAMGIILKRRSGMPLDPRLAKTVDRVLSVIESRSQEQFLDKSIALDRTSNQTLEKLKSSKLWNSVKGINKLRETVLFSAFKFSDYVSGAPMMLANIMHHEEVAGRATGWEGLTYNDDSFIRSLDETERFIGIGAASRRGVWTNNKNGWMSITRNIISAFSSHRVNNATNFAVEYARIKDENLSSEEKLKSLRYIMAIGAQSAVFSAVKWAMIGGFYNILTAAMGEDENEDELEKEYRKLLTGKHKPGDKKILEAEIAMREKIRNEFTRAKENNTRTDIVMIRGLQDVVANTFLIPAVSDIPLNMVLHAVYDQYEADRFKEVKEGEVKILEEKLKKAKASKNTNLAIQLQKDLSRWNAQEAIPLVYEQRGVVPMSGLYGGVVNEVSKFMDAAAGSLIQAEAMSLQDALLGAGLIGLSQPDINRWARMYSKIGEYEDDYVERLKEIKEKEIKKVRD
jgi:hypothetical protein